MVCRCMAIALLGISALCSALACGTNSSALAGEDGSRAGATGLALDTLHDDRVSYVEGDHTDWKSFELLQDTEVELRVWWDSKAVAARVTLFDAKGVEIAELAHDVAREMDRSDIVSLAAGVYFLKIEADKGASVYTLEIASSRARGGEGATTRPGF